MFKTVIQTSVPSPSGGRSEYLALNMAKSGFSSKEGVCLQYTVFPSCVTISTSSFLNSVVHFRKSCARFTPF